MIYDRTLKFTSLITQPTLKSRYPKLSLLTICTFTQYNNSNIYNYINFHKKKNKWPKYYIRDIKNNKRNNLFETNEIKVYE